jgi:hypothetical protein
MDAGSDAVSVATSDAEPVAVAAERVDVGLS